jgi:hypothetical protein
MTDRELLEQAAKAAGLWDAADPSHGLLKPNGEYWNPLIDDGDALRLAVKLGMSISGYHHKNVVIREGGYFRHVEPITDCPYAATRRAIVRAAAEIGKEPK